MRVKASIFFSKQAKNLLKHMPKIEQEKVIKWFTEEKKLSIGGGDIIEYLKYLEDKKEGELNG